MTCKTDLCDTSYRLWYKANELSLNESEAVSQWDDESGFGENLTQSVGANQPDFKTRQIGPLPSIEFNSSGDILNATTDVFNNKKEFIVCFLIRCDSLASLREFIWYGTFSGDWSMGIGRNGQSLQVFIAPSLPDLGNTFSSSANAITNTTDFFRIGVIYDGDYPTNATRLRTFINGVQQVPTFNGIIAPRLQQVTDQTLRLGDTPGVPTNGGIEIPELIIQTRKVNVNELLEIDSYLATKYI